MSRPAAWARLLAGLLLLPTLAPLDPVGAEPARLRNATFAASSAADVLVSDPGSDASCSPCRSIQATTTLAAAGSNLLAGWFDAGGYCRGDALMGYAYSSDSGASWVDAGAMPAPTTGARYVGDPAAAVNPRTGRFYLAGACEGGSAGSGIGLAAGRFDRGAFTLEWNRQPLTGGSYSRFHDRPWLACDPQSGTVYLACSFTTERHRGPRRVEFLRLDSAGVAQGPPLVLSVTDGRSADGARVAVGPEGEIHVAWIEREGLRTSIRLRSSVDGGHSFGPQRTVAEIADNPYSGPPGYGIGSMRQSPGLAVGPSEAAGRGRLFVTWSEAVDFRRAPTGPGKPVAYTGWPQFFAGATPFEVGNTLDGALSDYCDVHLFRFSGARGQTVFFRPDSVVGGAGLWVFCASDTGSFPDLTYAAYTDAEAGTPLGFTLPRDGEYYLWVSGGYVFICPQLVWGYRIHTSWVPAADSDRARDGRDVFLAWSDGGAVWSTPVRLNDDPAPADNVLPEVAVEAGGRVHVTWRDFRHGSGCTALSQEYLASSADGGRTWGPNRPVSGERSPWPSTYICRLPNQGHYQAAGTDGDGLCLLWTDARRGDPDVYFRRLRFGHALECPAPDSAWAGSQAELTVALANAGSLATAYPVRIEDDRGWIVETGATDTLVLAPGARQEIRVRLRIPGDAPPGQASRVRVVISDRYLPGTSDTCEVPLVSLGPNPPPTFRLFPARPNPARGLVLLPCEFSRPGRAALRIYSTSGRRLRTLLDGDVPAGPMELGWDGRDDTGRAMPAGVYWARLEAEGRVLRRSLVWLR